jgi:hypothetical protein
MIVIEMVTVICTFHSEGKISLGLAQESTRVLGDYETNAGDQDSMSAKHLSGFTEGRSPSEK